MLTKRKPVVSWIFDDTGFLKQGSHSVGVQRQYTGSAGKITNCQIGVNLTVTTPTEHLPIDFELYLPQSWTEDQARRLEARIPDEVQFQTKPELAIAMLRRAAEAGVPRGTVLGDSAYGHSSPLRRACRELGFSYAVAVMPTDRVWRLDCRAAHLDQGAVLSSPRPLHRNRRRSRTRQKPMDTSAARLSPSRPTLIRVCPFFDPAVTSITATPNPSWRPGKSRTKDLRRRLIAACTGPSNSPGYNSRTVRCRRSRSRPGSRSVRRRTRGRQHTRCPVSS